ncbi:hypothetical protein A7982_13884 [Minicystis rosea]|nr:hypothetical protein A7982_13884 [Minicystis rosea]
MPKPDRYRDPSWPYEDVDARDTIATDPRWSCSVGFCTCPETHEVLPDLQTFTILLCDEHARHMPKARCRVLADGILLNDATPKADAGGRIEVKWRRLPERVLVEWAPENTPLDPRYPFRKIYYVELSGLDREEATRRRLHNLGYSTCFTLEANIRAFQRAYGIEETGNLDDEWERIRRFHDDEQLPPRPADSSSAAREPRETAFVTGGYQLIAANEPKKEDDPKPGNGGTAAPSAPATPGKMMVGFNYPWSYNRHSADFGPNPHMEAADIDREAELEQNGELDKIPAPAWADHIDRNLTALSGMGVKVIRWFILGNGLAYGPPPTEDGVFTPPTRVDKRFKLHLGMVLDRMKKHGMKLIPSLLDFHIEYGTGLLKNERFASGGRRELITSTTKRDIFFDTMLADLLAASASTPDRKESILAWEVMNEPGWVMREFYPSGRMRVPRVKQSELTSFLEGAISRIESAGFRSTVGHRFSDDLNILPAGNMKQFHYYAKGTFLPNWLKPKARSFGVDRSPFPAFSQTSAFVGEIDAGLETSGNMWPDLDADQTLTTRLQFLESKGYKLAMLWPDIPKDNGGWDTKEDRIKLTLEARKSLVAYTGGTAPTNRT